MEENVILYSNHCVKCNILKELLDKKNIKAKFRKKESLEEKAYYNFINNYNN